jgi:hypothetical protein
VDEDGAPEGFVRIQQVIDRLQFSFTVNWLVTPKTILTGEFENAADIAGLA